MKYTPETYEWERGDVICSREYDAVGIRVKHDYWKLSNGTTMTDENATRSVTNGSWAYLTNRREL